ncbi:MAG: hypothetical protein V3T41_11175 [bacterium]
MYRPNYWMATLLAAAAAASAAPINYAVNVVATHEVDEASAELANAFGIPSISRTDTSATFSLEEIDGGVYRLTFLTASQQTLAGDAVIPDVEKVADFLPGRWLEFAPWTLAEGGVKRAPDFVKDSEEISYNLLALMLFPPGGPKADLWRGGARAAVARSYGISVVSMEAAEAQLLPAFEGEESEQVEFSVAYNQKLSQDTSYSAMTGRCAYEGVAAAVPAPDGLPAYARLDIAGTRDRSFIIGGKQRDLAENIATSIKLVREGYELPAEWVAAEEVTAE